MLRALSPSGFGSRWLSWENSTSGKEFRPVCANAAGMMQNKAKNSGIWRIEFQAANLVRGRTSKPVVPSIVEGSRCVSLAFTAGSLDGARDDGQRGGGRASISLLKRSKFEPSQPTFERAPDANQ